MYNANVILFFEFLKENKEVLENLDIHDLNLETVEDKLIPFAKENGFDITAKDIFRFLNEYQKENSGPIDDNLLEDVAGGKGNFNRFMAVGLLALTGITGFMNTNSFAANTSGSSVSQSEKVRSSRTAKPIQTIKDENNNTLSKEEKAYYQSKMGKNYRFVSDKGMSGSFATAYKIEDMKGKQFVLKISNNPANTKTWLAKQKATADKIKKYYKDYKGGLKLPNYVSFGEDFVIEENLGNQVGREASDWSCFSKEEISKFVNDMAEFLKYTHSHERGNVKPLSVGFNMFTLEDAVNYLYDGQALNPQELGMFKTLIESFKYRDTSDEITSLIHSDIRSQNIVYNSKTKQFGLIDFESLETDGNIYHGFTSKTMGANGIPYDVLSGVVDRYNEISDFKISKEKVKMIHKVGALYEIAMNAKYRLHLSGDDVKKVWEQNLKIRFENIDKGFGSDSENNNEIKKYDDVRGKDLSGYCIKDENVLRTLKFDEDTVWPDSSNMPKNVNPRKILEDAKNPGMEIKKLHKQGITGNNVHIAIIDGIMEKCQEHPEYKNKIVEFKSFLPEEVRNSKDYTGIDYHGPAMTSVLAGKNVGIAPEVKLHYIEVPQIADAKYYADALNYIIEKNKYLNEDEKIKVVSVSAAPSGNPLYKNKELWDKAYNNARKNGILVIDAKDRFMAAHLDYKNVDDISKCFVGEQTSKVLKEKEDVFKSTFRINSINDLLFVPCGPKTEAKVKEFGKYSYHYKDVDMSESIATISGIIALGLQVNPKVSNDEIMKVLNDTAYVNKQGFKIVNPEKFVSTLKNSKT